VIKESRNEEAKAHYGDVKYKPTRGFTARKTKNIKFAYILRERYAPITSGQPEAN